MPLHTGNVKMSKAYMPYYLALILRFSHIMRVVYYSLQCDYKTQFGIFLKYRNTFSVIFMICPMTVPRPFHIELAVNQNGAACILQKTSCSILSYDYLCCSHTIRCIYLGIVIFCTNVKVDYSRCGNMCALCIACIDVHRFRVCYKT